VLSAMSVLAVQAVPPRCGGRSRDAKRMGVGPG
jgi:hypothetical protein